ncbi:hypothetical protein J7L67_00250 [bacterium]|nr:hypothetical protein [bacterium]
MTALFKRIKFFPNRNKVFLVLIVLFSFISSVGYAKSDNEIRVNRKNGRVINSKQFENAKYHIVHIQDAHCNAEAQINIANMLEELTKSYNITLVGLEGAEGKFATGRIAAFPDKQILKNVAKYFLNSGKICGSEYFSILENNEDILLGIEDKALYLENYNKFMESLPIRNSAVTYFENAFKKINKIQDAVVSENIKEFNNKLQKINGQENDFSGYCKLLKQSCAKYNIATGENKNFNKFMETLELEKKINFERVNGEKANLIDKLSKVINKKDLAQLLQYNLYFRINKISPLEYYDYLSKNARFSQVDMNDYPNFNAYTQYLENYDCINQKSLFNECDLLVGKIRGAMALTEDDRQVIRLLEASKLLKKYTMLELSTTELDKIYKPGSLSIKEFDKLLNRYCKRLNLSCTDDSSLIEIISSGLPILEKFYSAAKKRDDALVEKLVMEMELEGNNIAVLIAGGFHTEGIIRKLEQKGISYDIIIPEITREQKNNPYFSLMSNIKTKFEEVLSSNTLQIPLRTAKLNLLDQDNQVVFAKEIDSALAAMTADTRISQAKSEVEMIDSVNKVLDEYGNKYSVKVLGRATIYGEKGYRGYLMEIAGQRFTFIVRDQFQIHDKQEEGMSEAVIEDKYVTVFPENKFENLLAERLTSPVATGDNYDVALSAPFKKQLTYKAIDRLLTTLYNMGEITDEDINEEIRGLGVDVRSEIHAFLSYFVERGLLKIAEGLEEGEKSYSWYSENAQINILSLEQAQMRFTGNIEGSLISGNEVTFFDKSIITKDNLNTTGKIKFFYFEEKLPMDIHYRILAELYAGRAELFNVSKPTHIEFESTNGKVYAVSVVYRPEDDGYFFRVGLKEDITFKAAQQVEQGRTFIDSPVVSLEKAGLRVAAANPFDHPVVGLPKLGIVSDAEGNVIQLKVRVFNIDKNTRKVLGFIDKLSVTADVEGNLNEVFKTVLANIKKSADNSNIGLLHPVLSQRLSNLIPPDEVDRSMLGVGIQYPPVQVADMTMELNKKAKRLVKNAEDKQAVLSKLGISAYTIGLDKDIDQLTASPEAMGDLISILYSMLEKGQVDKLVAENKKRDLVNLFYNKALPMAQNVLQTVLKQYNLSDKPIELQIKLAPGPIAEAHFTEENKIKIVLNAHVFRSPGLLFAQIEHEIRHDFVKGQVAEILPKHMPADQITPRITDFITELYISSKELERYDQFGLEAQLGVKTRNELKSPDNPIDLNGEFFNLTQLSGQARFSGLLNIVSARFFAEGVGALPAPYLIQDTLDELNKYLSFDKLDGNFSVYMDKQGNFDVVSADQQEKESAFIQSLIDEKAAVFAQPQTVRISPEAQISHLVTVGADSVILGDNIKIGRKVKIGKGAKIISDGGKIIIGEGVKIDDGVVIRAKVGQTIKIGPGTIILNGAELTGNVTVGEGAVIDQSKIKNAFIGYKKNNPTIIRASNVWGETFDTKDRVIIEEGVQILYSDIKTMSEKKGFAMLDRAPSAVFQNNLDLVKYHVNVPVTIIKSGAVIEKAIIENSEIGKNVIVREHALITNSVLKENSLARVNAKINLTYMGKGVKIGSVVDKCYFGDGATSEHQGTRLEHVVMPNEYIIVDENGNYQVINLPNTSNIGAGTIIDNKTGIPVIGYDMFTAINSEVVTSEDNPTVFYPFTLTKGVTGGTLLPFAFSAQTGTSVDAWVLNNYAGAIINHYKKKKALVKKLGYKMDDFDKLFEGTLRLTLKLLDDTMAALSAKYSTPGLPVGATTDSIAKEIEQIKKTKNLITAHIKSQAWKMENGVFINGMFSWQPGDKWTTPTLDAFTKMSSKLQEFTEIYSLLNEHLKISENRQPEIFDGKAKMGTDGIRGVAENSRSIDSTHVTPVMGYRLGLVGALYAAYQGKDVMYVGGDTRSSTPYLIKPVVEAAEALGMTVKDTKTSVDHTPAVQYKVRADDEAGSGVIVTASHNPASDNGFKLITETGSKIPANWEKIANRIVNARDLNHELALVIQELGGIKRFGALFDKIKEDKKGVEDSSDDTYEKQYIRQIVDSLKILLPKSDHKRTLIIDTSSGAGVRIFEKMLPQLNQIPNFEVKLINKDGVINKQVGAEYIHKKLAKDIAAGNPLPQWLEDYKGVVLGTLDGDADRNLMFRLNEDNQLEVIDGDKFAALKVAVLQKYMKAAGLDDRFQVGVAQTVLANMGSSAFYKRHGINPMETAVGDKYVREAAVNWIKDKGVAVYYEAAGHGAIVFSDDFINSVNQLSPSRAKDILQAIINMQNKAGGDGIQNLLLFKALMELEGLDFDKLNDPQYLYAEIPKIEMELKVKHKENVTSVDNLGKELTGPEDIVEAAKKWQEKLGDQYRIIIRYSGTSPKVRVQIDGPDTALIEEAAYDLMQAIYDSPNVIGDPSETQPKDKYTQILEFKKSEQLKKELEDFQRENLPKIERTIREKFTEDSRYAPTEVTGRAEVGTDGIRGEASPNIVLNSKQITPPVSYRMGITAALIAMSESKTVIHVAGDTRPSTNYLMDAFIAGAEQFGITVKVDGENRVSSTPALQLFERVDNLSGAGGIITASHNPAEDNGIKLIDAAGGKISAQWEAVTNEIVNSDDLPATIAKIISTFQTDGKIDENKIYLVYLGLDNGGKIITDENAALAPVSDPSSYVNRIVEAMTALSKLSDTKQGKVKTFIVDTAAGAGTKAVLQIAEKINKLQEQGKINLRLKVINSNGVINKEVGAEYIHKKLGQIIAAGQPIPQWIENLKGVEIGTLDGDADRNLLFKVTEDGEYRIVDGDKFAALKAMVLDKYIKILGLDDDFKVGVAQTVLANLGSKGFFDRMGIDVQETAVGDKYVRQAALDWIQKNGVAVYYEAAGHGSIVVSDDFKTKLDAVVPNTKTAERAKNILQNIMKLQNEAGGDGIMNLLLFRMLMQVENLTFDQLLDDNFMYADLPKTELSIKVEHKENVTSVNNLGKELTGPSDIVDFVKNIQDQLAKELQARIDRGEINESQLPVKEFRVIVRASGTSPSMRVQVDGPVEDMVEKAAYEIMQAIYESENVKGLASATPPIEKYNEILKARKQKLLDELTVTKQDGAKYIQGWDKLTETEQFDLLLDLSRNGLTSDKLSKLIDIHEQGGETAVEPPAEPAVYQAPDMKDISRANIEQRRQIIELGSAKQEVDRSALVIIAGGDGGRLLTNMGFTPEEKNDLSKPTIPVTAITRKPPLQRIMETMAKIRQEKNSEIPIVIVVGPKSGTPIRNFLKENHNFAIANVIVVEQGRFPVMKSFVEGQPAKILLSPDKKVVYNPDGTGGIVDILGTPVKINGKEYASSAQYLRSVGRDKVVFWQGDVAGLTDEMFYGILGVSKGVTGKEDVDVVGLAYASDNKKLGTMVLMNGQRVLIIEGGDRNKYLGLEDADDTSGENKGLPRNSGGYMMSLDAIEQVMANFPVHMQRNKDVVGFDPVTGETILKADKMEKFFPDIFPLVTQDTSKKVIIAIADEKDMVPQKSMPQLHKASIELVEQDKTALLADYPLTIHKTAYVELSPLFKGSFGNNVVLGPKAQVYVGSNFVVGNNVVIGMESIVKGENISLGNNVVITNGSNIDVQGNGSLVIEDAVVIDGNVQITVKDGEKVVIGRNTKLTDETLITGQVNIGDGSVLAGATVKYTNIGNRTTIEKSLLQGLSVDNPVVIGNDVTIVDHAVITNVPATKNFSFLGKTDIRADFIPTDLYVMRKYKVNVTASSVGDGSVVRDARIINTAIGSKTVVDSGVSIEHSEIGDRNHIMSGANITISHIGNDSVIGSEVSKSYFGDGLVSRDATSYLSTITPNEFIIADEQGNLSILSLPNPTIIGAKTVFANYGGKPLPDLSGSLKGTSVTYASFVEGNVVNLYEHPDIPVTGLVNEQNVTVIYPFSKLPNGEVWGTVLPFTEASTLSPSKHKIGAVLENDPRMIVDMVKKMYDLLPDGQKDKAKQVVEGSLWLGVKLINDQIAVLKKKLDKRPDDKRAIARIAQLEAGLALYKKHLDGRWADPLNIDYSAIAMSNYDSNRKAVEFMRVYGNRDSITLEDDILDEMISEEFVSQDIPLILKSIYPSLSGDLKIRFDAAYSPEGNVRDQLKLFTDIAKDRLKQVRDILSLQYRGVQNLTFVLALSTEKLAERNVAGDNRIVINAYALISPLLMFSQAEHELIHELIQQPVSETIASSNMFKKQVVQAMFEHELQSQNVADRDIPVQTQRTAKEFYEKLQKFMREEFVLTKELKRLHSFSKTQLEAIRTVLHSPGNPIDLGKRFDSLIETTQDLSPDETRKAIHEFIFNNYDGMDFVKTTLHKLRDFNNAVNGQISTGLITADDFDLLSIIDKSVKPNGTDYSSKYTMAEGQPVVPHFFDAALKLTQINDSFVVDIDDRNNLAAYDLTTDEKSLIVSEFTDEQYDISAIDFDVFGDSKITNSNSLFLADALKKLRDNANKNARVSKVLIFSIRKDADEIQNYLRFHGVDPAALNIIDRNDIAAFADAAAKQDEQYKNLSDILNNASKSNDYSILDKIFEDISKDNPQAVEYGSKLMDILLKGFNATLNLPGIDITDIKLAAGKPALVQMALTKNIRTIEWNSIGSDVLKEGDLIEAGVDNLLLLQVLEPGSEVPRELVVSAVAPDKIINGINVYDLLNQLKQQRQQNKSDEPITIEDLVAGLNINYLTKEDLKGIGVKAPKRKIDKEFMQNLQKQRLFDEAA